MKYLDEDSLSEYLERQYKRYTKKLNNTNNGNGIDDMAYTKHLYWERGFHSGVLFALYFVADEFLDDNYFPNVMRDKVEKEKNLIK